MVLRERHWTHETEVFRHYFCLSAYVAEMNRTESKHIKGKERKNELFIIMTKHKMRIFGVYPFFQAAKQQLNGEK